MGIDLICEVRPGKKKDSVTLQWLAGIKSDKRIGILKRDWLNILKDKNIDFESDGPENIGEIGVWNWKIKMDQNDTNTLHIQSQFNEQIKPIEVILLEQQVNSKEEISNYLRSRKVTATEHGLNVLICFPLAGKNDYLGIYCTNKEYQIINSKLQINIDIKKMPLYSIDNKKIIRTERCNFYYLLKIEDPTDFIDLKSSREILIDLLLKHSQWSSLSVKGLTQKDCNTIDKYLNSFLHKGFFEEYAEKSGCSLTEAKAICRDFVENSDTYLREKTDEENQFLNDILKNNPSLRKKYEKIMDDQWHEEFASKVEVKQKELKDLQKKIRKDKRDFNKWKKESSEEKEKVQKEIDELTQKKEDEKCALEEAESQRSQIKRDLANIQNQIKKQQEKIEKEYADRSVGEIKQTEYIVTDPSNIASLFIEGQPLADDDIDEFDNWNDFSLSIMDNLETAGVENNEKITNLLKGLASFLYAAYINEVPILLAGPNAKNIADAFSAAVYGKLADQFYCEGEYQYTKLKEVKESDFVTIHNIFHADWIDHVDEITEKLNYCWFTNAFAENLIIEPKGLYNYMLPLVTDLFVESRPKKGYYGKQVKDFEFEGTSRTNKDIRQFLKTIGSGSLYRKNIETVLITLGGMPGYCEDWEYYFALLPYAVVTGNENILCEMLGSSDQNVSKGCCEIIKRYFGENQ